MEFIIIGAILLYIMVVNDYVNQNKFVKEIEPYFRFMMESDYEFLLKARYGSDVEVDKLYGMRVRNGVLTVLAMVIFFLSNMTYVNILIAFFAGFFVFKMQYLNVSAYYKKNLSNINLLLPYYLKSLEILIQHYTVPVAITRSINTAPAIFQAGLKDLILKIDSGDSTIQPYVDFAKQYPVRDSMRMMRLLYRLGLGSQENKHEQLMMFSRTVSSLQNKSRELKYKNRLDSMEQRTLLMLGCTGGGVLLFMLIAMSQMMSV